MFTIAGFVFFIILVHYVYDTLSRKNWEKDDNDGVKTNKWEALEEHEEQRNILEEIAAGTRKPESGVQWEDDARTDTTLPFLEPSHMREKDFEMQWINPELNQSKNDRILTARPSRWSVGGYPSSSDRDTHHIQVTCPNFAASPRQEEEPSSDMTTAPPRQPQGRQTFSSLECDTAGSNTPPPGRQDELPRKKKVRVVRRGRK